MIVYDPKTGLNLELHEANDETFAALHKNILTKWSSPGGRAELNRGAHLSMKRTEKRMPKTARKNFRAMRQVATRIVNGMFANLAPIKDIQAQNTLRVWREAKEHMVFAVMLSVRDEVESCGSFDALPPAIQVKKHLMPPLDALIPVIHVTGENIYGAIGIHRAAASKSLLDAWDNDGQPVIGEFQFEGVSRMTSIPQETGGSNRH